jgi:hypothetical protein
MIGFGNFLGLGPGQFFGPPASQQVDWVTKQQKSLQNPYGFQYLQPVTNSAAVVRDIASLVANGYGPEELTGVASLAVNGYGPLTR